MKNLTLWITAAGLSTALVSVSVSAADHPATTTPATPSAQTTPARTVGETVDDVTLVMRVKAAMAQNDTTLARDIEVNAYKGTIQLSGFANTQGDIDRAVEIARNVPGAHAIRNDVRLKNRE